MQNLPHMPVSKISAPSSNLRCQAALIQQKQQDFMHEAVVKPEIVAAPSCYSLTWEEPRKLPPIKTGRTFTVLRVSENYATLWKSASQKLYYTKW